MNHVKPQKNYLEIVYHTQLQDKKESYLDPKIHELWSSPIETSKEWIWHGTIKTTQKAEIHMKNL